MWFSMIIHTKTNQSPIQDYKNLTTFWTNGNQQLASQTTREPYLEIEMPAAARSDHWIQVNRKNDCRLHLLTRTYTAEPAIQKAWKIFNKLFMTVTHNSNYKILRLRITTSWRQIKTPLAMLEEIIWNLAIHCSNINSQHLLPEHYREYCCLNRLNMYC